MTGGIFDTDEIILELRHGEGGDDSKLFVDQLFSAYLKYARSLGFDSTLLHSNGGHKIAKITGSGAGYCFSLESGKHVCQRVPETESKGRKHTSTISVAVLPVHVDVDEPLLDVDLKVEAVNLGGKGGQHQNKTLSGCRITHLPTGLQVAINGRDYHSNEREARVILLSRVNDIKRMEYDKEYSDYRRKQIGGGTRSGKLRTYNFMQSRVSDHNSGIKSGNIKAVMKGEFEKIFPPCFLKDTKKHGEAAI